MKTNQEKVKYFFDLFEAEINASKNFSFRNDVQEEKLNIEQLQKMIVEARNDYHYHDIIQDLYEEFGWAVDQLEKLETPFDQIREYNRLMDQIQKYISEEASFIERGLITESKFLKLIKSLPEQLQAEIILPTPMVEVVLNYVKQFGDDDYFINLMLNACNDYMDDLQEKEL